MAINNSNNFPNPLSVAVGGTGVSTFTAYAPACGGTTSTGAIQAASTGLSTTNFVLTSNGAGALPSFKVNPTSSFVLLNTQTISSPTASVVFNSTYITSTYITYFLRITNVLNSTASASDTPFVVTFSTNNGSTYLSSSYLSGYYVFNYSVNSTTISSSTVLGQLGATSSAAANTNPIHGEFFFNFPQSGISSYVGRLVAQGSSQAQGSHCYGTNTGTTAINNIKLAYSANNISSGIFSLYGILK